MAYLFEVVLTFQCYFKGEFINKIVEYEMLKCLESILAKA